MASTKTRAPRPKQIEIDVSALVAQWQQWAQMKKPGFEWDASDYSKTSRSVTPDVEGLIAYAAPLRCLIEMAPTGFPTQTSLRQVFTKLQADFKIFGSLSPKQEFPTIADITDKWKIMCKHVHDMKMKQKASGKTTRSRPKTWASQLPCWCFHCWSGRS